MLKQFLMKGILSCMLVIYPVSSMGYSGMLTSASAVGTVIVSEQEETTEEETKKGRTTLAEAEYYFYKDGKQLDMDTNPEAADAQLYDGYVAVVAQDTKVTVTATANNGYDFMILNLTDEEGNVSTPLSKNYVQTGKAFCMNEIVV